jgi:hypothetical protein
VDAGFPEGPKAVLGERIRFPKGRMVPSDRAAQFPGWAAEMGGAAPGREPGAPENFPAKAAGGAKWRTSQPLPAMLTARAYELSNDQIGILRGGNAVREGTTEGSEIGGGSGKLRGEIRAGAGFEEEEPRIGRIRRIWKRSWGAAFG